MSDDAYAATHGGIEATERVSVVPRLPRRLTGLGELLAVEYGTDKGDGDERFRHEFRGRNLPVLAFDERGKLHVIRQRDVYITSHGIEDGGKMAKKMTVPSGSKGKTRRRRYRGRRRNAGAMEYLMNAGKALASGLVAGGLNEGLDWAMGKSPTMTLGQKAVGHGVGLVVGSAVGAVYPTVGAAINGAQTSSSIRYARAYYATRPTTTPPATPPATPPGTPATPPATPATPPPATPPGMGPGGLPDAGWVARMSEYYRATNPTFYRDTWEPWTREYARALAA